MTFHVNMEWCETVLNYYAICKNISTFFYYHPLQVYVHPPMISATFLAVYAINLVLNIAWLFTWDRQYVPVSTAVLALLTFSLYVCLWLNHRAVKRDIDQLYDHHKYDIMSHVFNY